MNHRPITLTDDLGRRLRAPLLRTAYAAWLAHGSAWYLPGLDAMDAALADPAQCSLAEVERGTDPPGFRLVRVGAGLNQPAGRCLVGDRIGAGGAEPGGPDPLGGAAWAYRRCFSSARPGYEFGHFDFGDSPPLLFERLLLPLGRGAIPTHILGCAVFSGIP